MRLKRSDTCPSLGFIIVSAERGDAAGGNMKSLGSVQTPLTDGGDMGHIETAQIEDGYYTENFATVACYYRQKRNPTRIFRVCELLEVELEPGDEEYYGRPFEDA